MKSAIGWGGVAVWLVATAQGAPLNRAYIADDARMVLHLDVDQLKKTQAGAWFLDELRKPEAENKFAAFKLIFNFDPREDLRSVSAYGRERDQGVALLEGNFDIERAVAMAKAAEAYETTTYDGETVHSWVSERRRPQPAGSQAWGPAAEAGAGGEAEPAGKVRHYAIILPQGLMIAGDRLSWVQEALDVVRGRRAALAPASRLSALIPSGSVPFFVAAADLAGLPPRQNRSQTFDGLSTATLTLGEQRGGFSLEALLEAKDEATAGQILGVAQGLISLGLLRGQNDPRSAALLRSVNTQVSGRAVRISLSLPAAELIEMLQRCKAPLALPADI